MRKIMLAAALLLVSGCGGGGGDSGPEPVQLPPNASPQFGGGTISLSENVASTTLTASDANGDPLTFTVSGGPDAGQFTMNGTQLTFRSAPNFEAPTDADGDNVYRVTVTVSDGKASVSGDYVLTVLNDREGVAVRRVASIGEPWRGGTRLDGGSVRLLTSHAVHAFNLQTDELTVLTQWDPLDGARGRFLSIATSRLTPGTPMILVTARLANGFAGLWTLGANGGGNSFHSYWNYPLTGMFYDNMVEDAGPRVGICPSGNNCIAYGLLGRPADATSGPYGQLVELPYNADPYAGASVSLYGPPIVRATGLRLPLALSHSLNPSEPAQLLLLDQGDTRFDEVNAFQTGGTVDFGWPSKEGTHVLAAGGGPFRDPEVQFARGTGTRQSLGITALAHYVGGNPSLIDKTIAVGRDGRVFTIDPKTLFNGTTDGEAAIENRTLDFTPDTGTIDHIVAVVSTGSKTLLLDRDGDLFVLV